MSKDTMQFQAQTQKVLDIMIHSLYTQKEVFIRELVSNASDAIDKIRFQAVTDQSVLGDDAEFKIVIKPDPENKTVTISDNGIGMDRQDVIDHLGTIAKSGSKEFLERLSESKKDDIQLIGQFGVGFYSAFMVADKVTVETKKTGDGQAVRWESTGDGTFTVEECSKDARGTSITMHLKDDETEFLDEWRIRSVIKQYSDYVSYPIELHGKKTDKDGKVEDTIETVNRSVAIWRRPKSDIKPEEYNEFYKYLSHDSQDPITYVHQSAEGVIEFKMLLFVPTQAPFDIYTRDYHGVRLYVKKMFVMDNCKDIVPPFLRFVRGIVDSEDLPLNISRQTLQSNAVVNKIKRQLTTNVLNALETLKTDKPEEYKKFYEQMGAVLKEGVASAMEHKDKLSDLLLFSSTKTAPGEYVGLAEYVERMAEGQNDIYYLTGTSLDALAGSPQLEIFRKKGIEVLLLSDPVDEWVVSSLSDYKDKKLKSAAKGQLDLGEMDKEEKEELKKAEGDFKDLCDFVRSNLQDDVKQVRVSNRMDESPCCLVVDENDMGANMEQIMKALHQDVPTGKKIMELNPAHPLIKKLHEKHSADAKDPELSKWVNILFDQCLLAQGVALKNPSEFVKNINEMLAKAGS